MRARLVATDLDGTLLRSDGTVSVETEGVLAAVEEAGVPLVFVTARPLRWMEHLWRFVGRHGLALVSNGALLFDVAERRVLETRGIAPDVGLPLVDAVAAALPDAAFALECVSGLVRDPRFVEPNEIPPGSPVGPLAELWVEPALKLMVRCPGADDVRVRAAVTAAVGARAVATWSGPGLVEVSAPGVTKAAGLARVAARLGVDAADVVAFGDQPNDLTMLAWAGTSCAVANADPAVRTAADHVVPANDDDGVARTLAALLAGRGLPTER
ncbi:HAD family hydrolase [Nocardioides marinquilinus]|uniref:HAD family hydrolase n=1 Tax=Nocardioides marinquilinus TaxID=1210400 RepID=A0ABP9P6S1_9ACTN